MLLIAGEKSPQEIQSASTLVLGTTNQNNNNDNNDNNNNNNNNIDYTDSPNTVVIGQKVASTHLLQAPEADVSGEDPDKHSLAASPSQKGSPRMRRVSVCLEGAVVCESTFMVDSNNKPDPTRVLSHDSTFASRDNMLISHDRTLISHDSRRRSVPSDTGSIASERNSGRTTECQEGWLQTQPSAFLEVPLSSPKRVLVDLEEEKLAVAKYHRKNTL